MTSTSFVARGSPCAELASDPPIAHRTGSASNALANALSARAISCGSVMRPAESGLHERGIGHARSEAHPPPSLVFRGIHASNLRERERERVSEDRQRDGAADATGGKRQRLTPRGT
jgi:hypothetical protein